MKCYPQLNTHTHFVKKLYVSKTVRLFQKRRNKIRDAGDNDGVVDDIDGGASDDGALT